jgi:hypothetical protein
MATAEGQLRGEEGSWQLPSPAAADLLQEFISDKVTDLLLGDGFDSITQSDGLDHLYAEPADDSGNRHPQPQAFMMHYNPESQLVVAAMFHTRLPDQFAIKTPTGEIPPVDNWFAQIVFTDAEQAVLRTWHKRGEQNIPSLRTFFDQTDLVDFPAEVSNPQTTIYGADKELLKPDPRGRLLHLAVRIGQATDLRLGTGSAIGLVPAQRKRELVGATS